MTQRDTHAPDSCHYRAEEKGKEKRKKNERIFERRASRRRRRGAGRPADKRRDGERRGVGERKGNVALAEGAAEPTRTVRRGGAVCAALRWTTERGIAGGFRYVSIYYVNTLPSRAKPSGKWSTRNERLRHRLRDR